MSCDPVALEATLNEAENEVQQAMRAAKKSNFAKVWADVGQAEALLAEAKAMCHDEVPHDHDHDHEHPASTPAPAPTGEPFHDVRFADFVEPAAPRTPGELNEGAFRYVANIAWVKAIDPIVAPGTVGQVHLHMGWGNTALDENSTYETLSTSGGSTITGDKLFRSGEWVPPPVFADIGMVWTPDIIGGYYKLAAPQNRPLGVKEVVNVPVGLRLIYGNTMMPETPSTHVQWQVWEAGWKAGVANGRTLADVIEHLTPGRQLRASISAPNCWNGETDSPDHRSHMAYAVRDPHTGKGHVPESHPYLIPSISRLLDFTVPDLPLEVLQGVRLSSDMPGYPAGSSMHGDYIECIHPEARLRMFNALLQQMNCSASNFGDGWRGVRPAGFTFTQRPNLIPVP